MKILKHSMIPGIAMCLTVLTAAASAGPLVTVATTIAGEITQVIAVVGGALLILWTLTSLAGGMGSRLILALVEAAIFFFIIENPDAIVSWLKVSNGG